MKKFTCMGAGMAEKSRRNADVVFPLSVVMIRCRRSRRATALTILPGRAEWRSPISSLPARTIVAWSGNARPSAMIDRSLPRHNSLQSDMLKVPAAAVGAETKEPERSRPMSEARDRRADDTTCIPPGGSATDSDAVNSSAPTIAADSPPLALTVDLNPGQGGPAVAETTVAPSPSVGETLGALASVDSTTAAGGGCTTDAGSGAMDLFADLVHGTDPEETNAAAGPMIGRRARPDGPPCRATRSSRRSAEAAWASSTKPGTSGSIDWSR